MPAVVTRFAPSPTGSLHIGGARTALFNWLYARHCGGNFLLRVEDTDRARSTEAAVGAIFEGLEWLGLMPDAEPVFQFARADAHRAVAEALVAKGSAFRCYMTGEESEAAKEASRAAGHALRSPWRDRAPGQAQSNLPYVVRLKVPDGEETLVEDAVRGTVRFPNKDLDDLVLLRSDGTPIYNLAVTVDDHDMGVTHVIRGEEHLSNAARQTLIANAMGWPAPVYAHLPLILGADGQKLSKRHGAQSVAEFRDMGFLPEAVRNYLARLGWGHGDDEIFSDDQAIAWFDIKDVVKSPAKFDTNKLRAINNHYIRLADEHRLAHLTLDVLHKRGVAVGKAEEQRLADAIPLVKEAAKTVVELADLTAFAVKTRPFNLDDKTQGLLTEEARARLSRLRDRLAAASVWELADLHAQLQHFAEAEGVGMGKFGPALRGVLSGGSPAPDLASTLFALRREEALSRIDDALSRPA